VADCAGPDLRSDGMTGGEWMTANNVLVEVAHLTAAHWGPVGAGIKVDVLHPP